MSLLHYRIILYGMENAHLLPTFYIGQYPIMFYQKLYSHLHNQQDYFQQLNIIHWLILFCRHHEKLEAFHQGCGKLVLYILQGFHLSQTAFWHRGQDPHWKFTTILPLNQCNPNHSRRNIFPFNLLANKIHLFRS